MAIRNIVKHGDDVLTKKCRVVEKIDNRILTLLDDMIDTMREADGVKYFFVECYEPKGADIKLDGEYYDMLADKTVTDVHFDGVGIAILKK